jgi:phosphoribosylglycinamide formyltransferase 1
MKRIVILISGQGSNMVAIAQACRQQGWPAQVVAVISNRPHAGGLAAASSMGLATQVLDHKAFETREAFDAALKQAIDAYAPDLLVLAGFMRVLTPGFVAHFQGRLLNIHPSLLPAFPGLHTHRAALAAGCKLAGATVHFVTADLDHGPIVLQAAVPVLPGDDEHALAQRVLAQEHRIYPQSVRWFVEGQLTLNNNLVRQAQGQAQHHFEPTPCIPTP